MTTDVCLEAYSEDLVALNVEVTLYLGCRTVKGRVIAQSEYFGQCIETLPTSGSNNSKSHQTLLAKWEEAYADLERRRSEVVFAIGEAEEQGDEKKAEDLRRSQRGPKFIHLTDVKIFEGERVETLQKPLRVKLENVEAWTLGR